MIQNVISDSFIKGYDLALEKVIRTMSVNWKETVFNTKYKAAFAAVKES